MTFFRVGKRLLLRTGSDSAGAFRVDEIVDYQQDDLNVDDIFLLDCFTELFIWVGSGANAKEKEMAAETAKKYVSDAPDGRDADCPITTVSQGSEPVMFSCHFLGWDPVAAAAFEDPYEAKMAELGQQAAAFSRPSPPASELIEKLGLEGVAPESEVQQMIVSFEYYDVDGGGFMDQEEFRKLAPTLIEQGLVRKGAERSSDLADAFGKAATRTCRRCGQPGRSKLRRCCEQLRLTGTARGSSTSRNSSTGGSETS